MHRELSTLSLLRPPQGAEEPKADAAAESNTETESVTDTAASEEPPETERKIEIVNNLSADIPGLTGNRELLGVVKAGAVAEMVQSVKDSGMKVEIFRISTSAMTQIFISVYTDTENCTETFAFHPCIV